MVDFGPIASPGIYCACLTSTRVHLVQIWSFHYPDTSIGLNHIETCTSEPHVCMQPHVSRSRALSVSISDLRSQIKSHKSTTVTITNHLQQPNKQTNKQNTTMMSILNTNDSTAANHGHVPSALVRAERK